MDASAVGGAVGVCAIVGAAFVGACSAFSANGTSAPADAASVDDAADGAAASDAGADVDAAPCDTCGDPVLRDVRPPLRISAAAGKLAYTDGTPDVHLCDAAACVTSLVTFASPGGAVKSGVALTATRIGTFAECLAGATEDISDLSGTSLSQANGGCPREVSAVGDVLYFTSSGVQATDANWEITRCGASGCTPVTGGATKPVLGAPTTSVAVGGVLYSGTDASHLVRWDGASTATPLLGGAVAQLATDGASLFWLDGKGVIGCTIADCPTSHTVIHDDTTAQRLAADASGLYWTSGGSSETDGKVFWLPPGAVTVRAIVTGQHQPIDVALDDGFVYWSNRGCDGCTVGHGEIRRIAKPKG